MRKTWLLNSALAFILAAAASLAGAQENARTFRKDLSILTQDQNNVVSISVLAEDESLLEDYSESDFEIIPIYAGTAETGSAKPGKPVSPDVVETELERAGAGKAERPRGSVVKVIYDLSSIELEEGVSGYYILDKSGSTRTREDVDDGVPVKKPLGWQQDTFIFHSAWGSYVGVEAIANCIDVVAWNGDLSYYQSPLFSAHLCPNHYMAKPATYESATVQISYDGTQYTEYLVWGSGIVPLHVYHFPGSPN